MEYSTLQHTKRKHALVNEQWITHTARRAGGRMSLCSPPFLLSPHTFVCQNKVQSTMELCQLIGSVWSWHTNRISDNSCTSVADWAESQGLANAPNNFGKEKMCIFNSAFVVLVVCHIMERLTHSWFYSTQMSQKADKEKKKNRHNFFIKQPPPRKMYFTNFYAL